MSYCHDTVVDKEGRLGRWTLHSFVDPKMEQGHARISLFVPPPDTTSGRREHTLKRNECVDGGGRA